MQPRGSAAQRAEQDPEAPWLPKGPSDEQIYAWLTSVRLTASSALDLFDRAILDIDQIVNEQLDAILHSARFQELEASWRGLHHLVDAQDDYDRDLQVKIKILDIGWEELARDVSRAIEFDQSHTFRLIYSEEFGMPGGEPFGVMLGDYKVGRRHRSSAGAGDVEVLSEMAQIASAALCPFITNADSELFGLTSFTDLARPTDWEAVFSQVEYLQWRTLRANEASRFVGITVPGLLLRSPYRDDGVRPDGFPYRERTAQGSDFLWGRGCYALGSVLIRAFANTGWFADIRGGLHPYGEGGVVKHLCYARFDMDPKGIAARPATEAVIDDHLERELSSLGFVPICSYHSTEHSVFYSNASLHRPPNHGSEVANANARLSAMLQYILCVSRFGHYIKVIARDKIGSFASASDCEEYLQKWLNQYTVSSDVESAELKARYPLSNSRVKIHETVGRPGRYVGTVYLQPHFQLDQLISSIKLVTEVSVGTAEAVGHSQ